MSEQLFSIWDMARALSFAFAAKAGVLHVPISNRWEPKLRLSTPKIPPARST